MILTGDPISAEDAHKSGSNSLWYTHVVILYCIGIEFKPCWCSYSTHVPSEDFLNSFPLESVTKMCVNKNWAKSEEQFPKDIVDQQSAGCCPSVGRLSADCRRKKKTNSRPTFDRRQLVHAAVYLRTKGVKLPYHSYSFSNTGLFTTKIAHKID